ncbi:MAG: hypothetical protein WDA02_03535 [Saccharofermentanales bacterium]
MKKITKKRLTVSLDQTIFNKMEERIFNRSKYIEHLIYQDLLRNTKDENLKKLLL